MRTLGVGMKTRLDLSGQKFGRLTAIKSADGKAHQAAWLCVCECGNERVVLTGNLRSGHTKSCGCIRGVTNPGGQNKDRANKYKEPIRPLDPVTYALRKRRYEIGMTQARVAKVMGWDKRSLCAAEAGKIAPTFGFVSAWAQALGMRLELREATEGGVK